MGQKLSQIIISQRVDDGWQRYELTTALLSPTDIALSKVLIDIISVMQALRLETAEFSAEEAAGFGTRRPRLRVRDVGRPTQQAQ